ncbi:MAG: DMT family transporter [Candidatus Dormibacteria bacterium]
MLASFVRRRGQVGRGDVLVLGATVIWSVNVVVVKLALHQSGPLTYSALRYVVGGLALWGLARWRGQPLPQLWGRDRWLIVALAVSGVLINQSSFTGSLALTNADNVAMISATTPLLVAIWVAWRQRQRFGGKVWLGLAVGLAGLLLVVGAGAGAWSGWLGIAIALGNPVSWAAYLLLLPRLLTRYRPLGLAALINLLGAALLLPFGVAEAVARPPVVTIPWLGLLAYSAVGAVALTTWLYLPGVRRLGPARTAVYGYLQPFLALLAALALIGESILPWQLLGGVIMIIGVVLGRPRPLPVTSSLVGDPVDAPGSAEAAASSAG